MQSDDHDIDTPPTAAPLRKTPRKGIYVLPNLFTLAALFGGFYAIVMAINGRFDLATIGVFAAMVLDSLDGRVARLTNTQSAFGEQMDSLSDMVSFGAAPALIAYLWALQPLGRWGWIAAFIYCAGAALRLARFNTTLEVVDKRFFQGLPSPAAAALVAGLVWVMLLADVSGYDVRWLACVLTIFAGLTMISNIRYYSFKDVNLKKSVPFFVIAAIALGFALVAYSPEIALFSFFVVYCLSGYVLAAIGLIRGKSSA